MKIFRSARIIASSQKRQSLAKVSRAVSNYRVKVNGGYYYYYIIVILIIIHYHLYHQQPCCYHHYISYIFIIIIIIIIIISSLSKLWKLFSSSVRIWLKLRLLKKKLALRLVRKFVHDFSTLYGARYSHHYHYHHCYHYHCYHYHYH